jgi:hypothetical protein
MTPSERIHLDEIISSLEQMKRADYQPSETESLFRLLVKIGLGSVLRTLLQAAWDYLQERGRGD